MTKTPGIWVRLTQQQKADMTLIAKHLPGNISDHGRQAISEYCDRVIPTLRTEQTTDKQAAQS